MNALAGVPVQLLSPSGNAPIDTGAITDEDRELYRDLAKLTNGHETHRDIAARVVWLNRDSLDFMLTIYAARDRIMHLAVRVADLEARLAASEEPAA
ncbi:hypothetical protein QYH69_32450 [Paraburkholderia sp. SARCC-3016]|uniref:hypothetical protein n=1 Tax=Paraburkholderia sp. SARCC-3016 TaxID=3058611 RepID=UPI002809CC92|nr:hypothetical protein [Paraburkholderia sp. SARCC-3016]MDQ7981936.1 hypothetical protein [Paraburkholderia sp. SARCC-3016]